MGPWIRTALLLLALAGNFAWAQPVEFRVGYEDKDNYDHTGSGSVVPENPGVMVELVKMLETRVPNLRIVFSRKPWARCLAELEVGAVDGIFSSSFKTERMRIGVYPMRDGKDDRRYRIDTKSYSVYTLGDSPLQWDVSRLGGLPQGLIALRGYAIVDDLKTMGVVVNEVNSPEDAFRMVLAGRVDGFAHLSDFGDYLLKKNPGGEFDRIVKLTPPIVTKDYYLQVSHQFNVRHPELVTRIWRALGELRQAESDRLVAKYLKLYSE